jgi:hypothetical protein
LKYTILIILVFNYIFSQAATVGLLYHDSTKASQGYTLFAPNTSSTTFLIDMEGKLVHKWESNYGPYLSVYLLENGHLLKSTVVKHANTNKLIGGFHLFDWDNNLIWEYYNEYQHHDVEYIPATKTVLVVTEDSFTKTEAVANGLDPSIILGESLQSVSIIEVKQIDLDSAEIVWRWNAWDHLVQDFDKTKPNYGVVSEHPELININYNDDGQDWLHTNSIDYNEALDQIVISNRNTNEIWIIDHSTTTEEASSHNGGNSNMGGDLLYRWGNPVTYNAGTEADRKLFEQHDANWIESGLDGEGNILIFNNGLGRPIGFYSSIVEIQPPLNSSGLYDLTTGQYYGPTDLIWEYNSDPVENFNSPKYGGAQRLKNGNTLICNSNRGEFFEVTPNNQIVWRYINPVNASGVVEQGTLDVGSNQVFRCYRYAHDYPGFDDKDLTPGDPIELYPLVGIYDVDEISPIFQLEQNYPNPFNPNTTIELSLSRNSNVTITIYDILGSKIQNLFSGFLESGMHSIIWDGLDLKGNLVGSGVYLYNVTTSQEQQTKKMILLR